MGNAPEPAINVDWLTNVNCARAGGKEKVSMQVGKWKTIWYWKLFGEIKEKDRCESNWFAQTWGWWKRLRDGILIMLIGIYVPVYGK